MMGRATPRGKQRRRAASESECTVLWSGRISPRDSILPLVPLRFPELPRRLRVLILP